MIKRLLFLLAFIFSLMPILGQETSTHFTFPITPKDSKWSEYKTTAERIRVLQIPENLLTSIPTEELLDICLDYPYLSDFQYFNDCRYGFKSVTSRFNGFKELLCRQDLTTILPSKISAYQRLKEAHSGKAIPMDLQVKIAALDLLITEENILNKFDKSTKSQIIDGVKARAVSVTDPFFVNVSNSLLSSFGVGVFRSYEPGGSIKDSTHVKIYTPNGTLIPTAIIYSGPDYIDSIKKAKWDEAVSLHPGIKFEKEADWKYNCHGYAWHMIPNNASPVWINDEDGLIIPNYWNDGSYIRVPEAISTHVYYSDDHSAIRINSNEYISKWGPGPLVRHAPENTSFGLPIGYFRIAPKITGPDVVSSESSFSIDNMPPNSTIEWRVSNGDVVIISGQGTTTVSVHSVSYGKVTITANIKYKGETIATPQKTITASIESLGESINFYTVTGEEGCWASNMVGNTFTIEGDNSKDFDRVEARLYRIDKNFNPSRLIQSWSNISTTGARIDGRGQGWYLFELRGVNKYYHSDWLSQEVEMVDFSVFDFMLNYENATEMLTLTFLESDTENSQKKTAKTHSTTKDAYKIELWNELSTTKVGSYQTTQTKYPISLAGMPGGIYIARVTVNGNTYSKKFIKN
ncbi:MAG: T9SS type A sorting domain-containing protein [Bacteroidaceae bacterium]|nr:T9SS type A sorting domain-containing protein [Bacteroidaceae bacterium]